MPATAADIPSELFDLILSFYDPRAQASYWERNNVPIPKRELGSIALVCRSWALACRVKIFNDIILRRLEDAEELLAFVKHPMSHIAEYLSYISFVLPKDSKCGMPWIHIACRKLKHYSKISTSVEFHLHARAIEPGELSKAVSSPGPKCNRIMCVNTLSLTDVRLARLEDLGRVVRALPCLKKVQLYGVEWNEPKQGELPARSMYLSPANAPTCTYIMENCTDVVAALWLACLHSPTKRSQMHKEDVWALWRVVPAVMTHRGHYRKSIKIRAQRERDVIYVEAPDRCKLKVALTSTNESQKRIHRLRFNRLANTSSEESDWSEVDERIAELTELCAVEFRCGRPKRLRTFANGIVVLKMPRLCCSSRLQFTLAIEDKGETKLICETDAVRQNMEHHLKKMARQCGWTSKQITTLLDAFRKRHFGAYSQQTSMLQDALGATDPSQILALTRELEGLLGVTKTNESGQADGSPDAARQPEDIAG
ncbi:hypothetical protein NM688_g2956 [Phlebia brevispora]|uniref:Uncharacterized protein n=1 Tax=Phlebia brevispora TaxID=194682 RepID=A0ACC1T7B3_9APHY|nr:hypothetical protein NM688_g2956 [Phlebia brevispora]